MLGRAAEFPYVLGTDGAGSVAAVGGKVKAFKEGDRVYAASSATRKVFLRRVCGRQCRERRRHSQRSEHGAGSSVAK